MQGKSAWHLNSRAEVWLGQNTRPRWSSFPKVDGVEEAVEGLMFFRSLQCSAERGPTQDTGALALTDNNGFFQNWGTQ